MPVFYDMVGLVGALLCGPISFVLPVVLYMLTKVLLHRHANASMITVGGADLDNGPTEPGMVPPDLGIVSIAEVIDFVRFEMPVMSSMVIVALLFFIGVIMVTGTASAVGDISAHFQLA